MKELMFLLSFSILF